jgi:hypothetical protein
MVVSSSLPLVQPEEDDAKQMKGCLASRDLRVKGTDRKADKRLGRRLLHAKT